MKKNIVCAADTVEQTNNASNNVSIYMHISNAVWTEYQENLNYSSKMLDEFVKGNMSKREAMVATTSLFTLASQTSESIVRVSPPAEFEDYHNYTLGTLVYFEEYLWCLAKFYETNDSDYAIRASDNFNTSVSFHKTAKTEIKEVYISLEHAEMERLILQE